MRWILRILGMFALLLASAAAQCINNRPGGSSVNFNRPSDADVAAARFSPLGSLNDVLPGGVCFTAGYRARYEGFSNGDSYLLTRFRLGMSLKPVDWASAYVELQDATAFFKTPPLAPPYQSTWDLRRAYVEIGRVEQSPISFRIGRQDINVGMGRLVGTSYWRNASRGYDAAMMSLHSGRLTVNAFASSPVVPLENGLSHHQQGNNLHGIYGALKDVVPGSELEPFAFWRLSPGIKTEEGPLAKLDEKTIGLRWVGRVSHWDYDVEAASQTGHIGPDRIHARAAMALAGYTFSQLRWKPRLFAEYKFASGDDNAKDGRHGTFDQLYPNIHDHHGVADQVAWQNLKETRSGIRISLRPNWTLAGIHNDWRLANPRDAYYNGSGGVVARDPSGMSGTHIGQEFDAETSYRLNRDLELGAAIARVLPGGFLVRTTHKHAYTYSYIMLNYNFF